MEKIKLILEIIFVFFLAFSPGVLWDRIFDRGGIIISIISMVILIKMTDKYFRK